MIVVSAGIAFESIESTFLSLISVYISAKGIDLILSGRANFKMVHISTNKSELLSEKLLKKLDLRGSVIKAKELDLDDQKYIILLIVESSKILELRKFVQKYDENSFIVVADASEIMGRGH